MVVPQKYRSPSNMSLIWLFLFVSIVQARIFQKNHFLPNLEIEEDLSWPAFRQLGQVPGLSTDNDGRLHVFHRGNRVWDGSSFDEDNKFRSIDEGPIKGHTIIVVDIPTGNILYQWGANLFYLPHGITIDDKGNTWITDVALHQVMKFPPNESRPMLTLGEAFVPGNDKHHFCKPTDVAVHKSGYFYVSDGYCNSRIVAFSPSGQFLGEIGQKVGMNLPHSLTLVLLHNMHEAVCVADRENGRILCFSIELNANNEPDGQLLFHALSGDYVQVFAIDHKGQNLFAVNGKHLNANDENTRPYSPYEDRGVVLDSGTGKPIALFGPPKGFGIPHDISVSKDGKHVFTSEIDPHRERKIYKFDISGH